MNVGLWEHDVNSPPLLLGDDEPGDHLFEDSLFSSLDPFGSVEPPSSADPSEMNSSQTTARQSPHEGHGNHMTRGHHGQHHGSHSRELSLATTMSFPVSEGSHFDDFRSDWTEDFLVNPSHDLHNSQPLPDDLPLDLSVPMGHMGQVHVKREQTLSPHQLEPTSSGTAHVPDVKPTVIPPRPSYQTSDRGKSDSRIQALPPKPLNVNKASRVISGPQPPAPTSVSVPQPKKPVETPAPVPAFVPTPASAPVDKSKPQRNRSRRIKKEPQASLPTTTTTAAATTTTTSTATTTTPTTTTGGRRRITKEQTEVMEQSFQQNQRPSKEERERIVQVTGVEPRSVQIWFQNRRAKFRLQNQPAPGNVDLVRYFATRDEGQAQIHAQAQAHAQFPNNMAIPMPANQFVPAPNAPTAVWEGPLDGGPGPMTGQGPQFGYSAAQLPPRMPPQSPGAKPHVYNRPRKGTASSISSVTSDSMIPPSPNLYAGPQSHGNPTSQAPSTPGQPSLSTYLGRTPSFANMSQNGRALQNQSSPVSSYPRDQDHMSWSGPPPPGSYSNMPAEPVSPLLYSPAPSTPLVGAQGEFSQDIAELMGGSPFMAGTTAFPSYHENPSSGPMGMGAVYALPASMQASSRRSPVQNQVQIPGRPPLGGGLMQSPRIVGYPQLPAEQASSAAAQQRSLLGRSKSAITLGSRVGTLPPQDDGTGVKRRKSIYRSAPMHTPREGSVSEISTPASQMSPAASPPAGARTPKTPFEAVSNAQAYRRLSGRSRSFTQPNLRYSYNGMPTDGIPESSKTGLRLQLEEHNNHATLVMVPNTAGSPDRGRSPSDAMRYGPSSLATTPGASSSRRMSSASINGSSNGGSPIRRTTPIFPAEDTIGGRRVSSRPQFERVPEEDSYFNFRIDP